MSQATEGQSTMIQGRIVWVNGDLFKGNKKTDQNTRQPIIDQKTGLQVVEYGFGLAVPKSVFNQVEQGQPGHIWKVMHEEAQKLYPNGLPPNFSMKYKDGDGVDHNGQLFSKREGYQGCLVFSLSTTIPIKFFRNDNNVYTQINEGIKCGDYVGVQVSVKAHGPKGQGRPGLYLNPNAVLFVAYGKEIVNGPNPDQIFGSHQFAIPEGGSLTPPQVQMPSFGNSATPATQGYAAPAMPGMPMQQPAQPHYGVLPPAHQPAAMPATQMGNFQGYAQPAAPTSFPAPTQPSAGFAPPLQQQGYANTPGMPGLPAMPR